MKEDVTILPSIPPQAGLETRRSHLLTYENTATFEKSIRQYKEALHAFFVEERLIKGK